MKTLASQLEDNSVDANDTKQLGGLLGGIVGGLPILGGGLLPNSPQCVYNNNCQFLGLNLYVVLNILDPVVCGNEICAGDAQCTHFTHNPITEECILQKDPAVPDRSFPSVSVWMSVYSVDSCKITTNELNLTNGFFKKWGNTKFHVGNKEILSVTL
jgi:hypothetical protein